jgi:hypothetical protein
MRRGTPVFERVPAERGLRGRSRTRPRQLVIDGASECAFAAFTPQACLGSSIAESLNADGDCDPLVRNIVPSSRARRRVHRQFLRRRDGDGLRLRALASTIEIPCAAAASGVAGLLS